MDELYGLNRRGFLKLAGAFTISTVVSGIPLPVQGNNDTVKLTILHTNDVHSRIEPFPMDGGRYQGLGGVARRSILVEKIRKEEHNTLLLDAGDMFQGTPYFNLFGGKLELELMSMMRYNAGTFGNHEFDNGLNGLANVIRYANFPFLIANYDFNDTVLNGKTKDYVIFRKQGVKIGVFGLGIELNGLVEPNHYHGLRYLNPITTANVLATQLKHDHKCSLVICLSHLGYKYNNNQVSDTLLAANTRNIDLILGGHTHTFMSQPENIINLNGGITTINQVGFGGINLGRIDYVFERQTNKKKILTTATYKITNEAYADITLGPK